MFINVALTKITDLVKREDFKSIEFIDDKNVTILFENKGCNVNSFGRVTWDDDEETETTWLKDSNTKLNKPTVSNLAEAVVSWISVEDKLPELCGSKDYNMHVVCLLTTGERQICYMPEYGVWESYEVNRSDGDVTHWMPTSEAQQSN